VAEVGVVDVSTGLICDRIPSGYVVDIAVRIVIQAISGDLSGVYEEAPEEFEMVHVDARIGLCHDDFLRPARDLAPRLRQVHVDIGGLADMPLVPVYVVRIVGVEDHGQAAGEVVGGHVDNRLRLPELVHELLSG
jgi:hypothetical protein